MGGKTLFAYFHVTKNIHMLKHTISFQSLSYNDVPRTNDIIKGKNCGSFFLLSSTKRMIFQLESSIYSFHIQISQCLFCSCANLLWFCSKRFACTLAQMSRASADVHLPARCFNALTNLLWADFCETTLSQFTNQQNARYDLNQWNHRFLLGCGSTVLLLRIDFNSF